MTMMMMIEITKICHDLLIRNARIMIIIYKKDYAFLQVDKLCQIFAQRVIYYPDKYLASSMQYNKYRSVKYTLTGKLRMPTHVLGKFRI